jgi:hypothetical protein
LEIACIVPRIFIVIVIKVQERLNEAVHVFLISLLQTAITVSIDTSVGQGTTATASWGITWFLLWGGSSAFFLITWLLKVADKSLNKVCIIGVGLGEAGIVIEDSLTQFGPRL